ncbi:MAG TPA: hypothetical protein VIP08_06290 [Phenylobacterium sp.]|uniref:hypothetical protein n=1 Tax=Phenylobacterium sp. TaxID=1871053 RepID=UPI002F93E8D7
MADGEASTVVQLQIAFAGHSRPRDLGDEAEIERKLAEVLKRLRQAGVTRARLLTGLAVGADRIAAGLWRLNGMGPVHAVLPFLSDSAEEVGLARLAQTATWLDGDQAHGQGCNPHLVQTRWMLAHADLLVVVWNGLEGRGAGGTADAVRVALEAGTPIVWLNPRDEGARIIRRPSLYDPVGFLELREALLAGRGSIVTDADVDALREALDLEPDHPHLARTPPGRIDRWLHRWLWRTFAWFQRAVGGPLEPTTWRSLPIPKDLASQPGFMAIREAFEAADAHAGRLAAIHRSEQILLLGAAVFAATIGATPFFYYGLKAPAIVAELLLALAAFAVWRFSARARWHDKWTSARRLAEHLRLFMGGWALGVPTGRAGAGALRQEHRRLGRSTLRQAEPVQGRFDAERVRAWATWALNELVHGQADYHRREGRRNQRIAHAIERLENGSFAVFVLVLGGAAIAALWGWLTHQHPPSLAMATAGAVGVIVPAIGAAAMALEAKFQFEEQTERSAVVADRLEKLASELPGDLNLEAAQMALRATAELLVAEADQWQEGGRRRRLFRGG